VLEERETLGEKEGLNREGRGGGDGPGRKSVSKNKPVPRQLIGNQNLEEQKLAGACKVT